MLEDDPSNMVYQFYEGREFFIKKQYRESVVSLEKAINGLLEGLNGYFSETLKTLLSAYEHAREPDEKIETMADLGIFKEPDQPDFWYFKAHVELRRDNFAEAARLFQESLERLDRFTIKEVSQSHPIISNNPWRAAELLGECLWEIDRFEESYQAYLRALKDKPNNSPKWGKVLNNTVALAIEFEDETRMMELFERLLARPDTSLEMFIFRVQQLLSRQKTEEAIKLLQWGRRRCARLKLDPTFKSLWAEHISP
jgi:tetratricopeptide (TPR) repeat protein